MAQKKCLSVGDYMQKDVVVLHPEDTVEAAITLMLKEKTNGTVVVDDTNHVVGILSSWDIIKYIVPPYLENDSNLAAFESSDVFCKRIQEVRHDPVSAMMTRDVHTATQDDALIEALVLLAHFHIRQLPIVDGDNQLVGYINRTDIKKAVGDVLSGKK